MPVSPWKSRLNRLDSAIRRRVSGRGDVEFVERLYDSLLGRAPEAEAVADARKNLSVGALRRRTFRRKVLSSPEYRASPALWKRRWNRLVSGVRRLASGEGDVEFIERLYEELLCRPPEAEAVLDGLRRLKRGLVHRGRFAREVASSPEFALVAPRRERRNWLRDGRAPRTTRSFAGVPPEEVWLELTTRCNVVPPCVMCGYAGGVPPGRRDMDPATWRALLPLLARARRVGLHGAGEPLLYPHLDGLLDALGGGPVVGFNSNGLLLTADVCRRLVDRRLGWISVSLDAANAGTYLRIRRRRDFEALLAKVRALRGVRDAAFAAGPRIEVNMTLMRENLHEAPGFVDLAARIGADGVMFQEMQPGGAHRAVAPDGWVFDYAEQVLLRDSRRDEILGDARRRAVSLGLGFSCEILYGDAAPAPVRPHAPGPAETLPPAPLCGEPWKRLLFDVDGNAHVCCVHRTNEVRLGSRGEDANRIWNGRRARLVREAMFAGPRPACCAGCYRTA